MAFMDGFDISLDVDHIDGIMTFKNRIDKAADYWIDQEAHKRRHVMAPPSA